MASVRSRIWAAARASLLTTVVLLGAAGAEAQSAADSAWARGDLGTAERLYRARLEADTVDDLALQRLAMLAAWDRRFEESLALFDRLLALTPSNTEARIAQGRVLAWKGDLGASLQAFDRALTVDPESREAFRARAQVLAWDRRLEDAAALYDSLARTDVADSTALFGSALVATWQWHLDQADELYNQVLRRAPGYLEARQGKARVIGARGNLVGAERAWREVLALDTSNVASRIGLAQVLRWQGRHEAALAQIERARNLAPFDRDVQDEFEWIWSRIGARVSGRAVFEQDSDNNRMFTVLAATNWPLLPGVQVEARAYRRSAKIVGSAAPTPIAYGGIITASRRVEPGWTLLGGIGVSGSDAPGTDEIVNLTAAVGTPVRRSLSGALSYRRYALDITGPQVLRNVRAQEVRVDAAWRRSYRWSAEAGVGVGDYNGTESNVRVAWNARLIFHFSPRYDFGVVTTFYAFQKDLNDGYFDPNFFGLGELEGSATWLFRRNVTLRLWGGSGLQQVRSGSALRATLRAQSRLTYMVLPGREIRLDASVSTSGVRSFATADADYRYGSVGLSFAWVF